MMTRISMGWSLSPCDRSARRFSVPDCEGAILTSRGLQRLKATLRLAMMNFGTLARPRIRLRDHKVLVAATFADGTTAYFRVAREAADQGSAVLLKLAGAAQGTGEIPAGEVISVKRVR